VYIQRQRLEACVRDLRENAQAMQPITDIALYWASPTFRISAACSAKTRA
jgi:hypothetical protein